MTVSLEDISGRHVSRETLGRLERYQRLLSAENARQNLVSATTLGDAWTRHVLDSAQLLPLAPAQARTWIDIGSGGGLPGIVVACFGEHDMTLIEPRRLRADFLRRVADQLGLAASIECAKAERIRGSFDVISARAVASLDRLLRMTVHLSHPATAWILPKGRNAKSELEEARRNWHCDVREVPSRTATDSAIFVIGKVRAKRQP